jgi:hypothetical protein
VGHSSCNLVGDITIIFIIAYTHINIIKDIIYIYASYIYMPLDDMPTALTVFRPTGRGRSRDDGQGLQGFLGGVPNWQL